MITEKVLKNIPGLKPEDTVMIKRLVFGEKCDLEDVVAEVGVNKLNPKQPVSSIKLGRFKIYLLAYAIKSVTTIDPILNQLKQFENKEVTAQILAQKLSIVRKLNDEAASFIFEQANLFNGPLDTVKKNE